MAALSPELIAFVESGISVLIGTRGPDLMPETVRGVGVKVWAGGDRLTVYVPTQNGARTLANLRDNGQIAITMSRPTTHETLQVKGKVTAMRDAVEADRPVLDRYLAALSKILGYCGLSHNLTQRMINWPATVVELSIADVFDQTPGPGAGDRLESAA